MQMNVAIIDGYLGHDPELNTTKSGLKVLNFSVATSYGTGDKRRTDWFDVTAWNKLAEICAKSLHKGSYVVVKGHLRNENYDAKNGTKIKKDSIQASEIHWDKPPRGESAEDEQSQEAEMDKDIPF